MGRRKDARQSDNGSVERIFASIEPAASTLAQAGVACSVPHRELLVIAASSPPATASGHTATHPRVCGAEEGPARRELRRGQASGYSLANALMTFASKLSIRTSPCPRFSA